MLQKIGKYQIVDRVGSGAMGEVYKAFDPMLKRSVALKVFSSHLDVTEELRARFFQEAQAGAMLSHPNIVTVHDLGEADGHLFIVMELLEGEELRRLIASRRDIGLEEKLSLMVQVCKGVEYAHRKGIIHRDIKPGNIFVLTNGHVKLLDFGVARLAAMDTGLTRAGLIMGTVRYMSPEQCRGRADYRSDIFSVGAVFYELLAYRPAFTGDDTLALLDQVQHAEPPPLLELDPSLPEPIGASVHRALQKDPSARFADIGALRIELERIHQQLREEADRVRDRVHASLREVQSLEQAVVASSGAAADMGPPVGLDEGAPLTSLQQFEAELAMRVEHLRSQLERARSVEPSLDDASRLTRAGDYDAAIEVFQRVVDEMPEHARASEGLQHARDSRQRILATAILDRATAAMSRRAYSDCIQSLNALSGLERLPPDLAVQADELRQAAQSGLSEPDSERAESDLTVLDTRLGDATRRRLMSPRYAGEVGEGSDGSDVEPLGGRRRPPTLLARDRVAERQRLFSRDTESSVEEEPVEDDPAPEGRRRTRARWTAVATVGALMLFVATSLFVATFWLGWKPPSQWHTSRQTVAQILLAWKASAPDWLTGNTSTPRAALDAIPPPQPTQSHTEPPASGRDSSGGAAQRQLESTPPVAPPRAESETPPSTRHEASRTLPPPPEAAHPTQPDRPALPLELPPRSLPPRQEQAPKPPPATPKAPPLAAPSPAPDGSVEMPSRPSPPARPMPSPDPTPAPKRSPLPALSANASLTETVAWLTQALTEHAEAGRLPSGVMYHVDRLDDCTIEGRTYHEVEDGSRVRRFERPLNYVDPNRMIVAERDKGWTIDLPWAEKNSPTGGEDSFSGLVFWFRERETATRTATAFKRAISLCSS
jgi:serine/threonine protein kinase